MPLLRFDLVAGRTDGELKSLLDAAHRRSVRRARARPLPDRARAPRLTHTGLGIPRTDKVVFLQVTSRKRKKKQKEDFNRLICKELEKECGISPSDLVVSFVENGDEGLVVRARTRTIPHWRSVAVSCTATWAGGAAANRA